MRTVVKVEGMELEAGIKYLYINGEKITDRENGRDVAVRVSEVPFIERKKFNEEEWGSSYLIGVQGQVIVNPETRLINKSQIKEK